MHSVVVEAVTNGAHLSRIRRVGFFLDDAGFTKNESFCAMYLSDVSTNERFLVAIVRKEELCKCGCRGFCTYYCIHDAVLQDLEAAALGRWQVSECDATPFPAGGFKSVRSGQPMGIILAVTELRADLPGYTGPVGMRSTAHGMYPCPSCNIKKSDLGNLNNITLNEGEWDMFSNAQFQAEVDTCRIVVRIATPEDVRRVLAAPLDYDHRPAYAGGTLGRSLVSAVTLQSLSADGVCQQLEAGDRCTHLVSYGMSIDLRQCHCHLIVSFGDASPKS